MRGLVQSLTIGKLCQNRSGLLALANDPHHVVWVSREHTIQISDRLLLLRLARKVKFQGAYPETHQEV